MLNRFTTPCKIDLLPHVQQISIAVNIFTMFNTLNVNTIYPDYIQRTGTMNSNYVFAIVQ